LGEIDSENIGGRSPDLPQMPGTETDYLFQTVIVNFLVNLLKTLVGENIKRNIGLSTKFYLGQIISWKL